MSYNTLTTQYRPQAFCEVIGQEVVCRILSKASQSNLVAPAYILSGTRGVGKTTLARIFAKALNCEHAPVSEPCNECVNCKRISKGSFVDVIELDAASNRSIDDMRELRENIQFAPMEGRYKVFILDEAHMLTKEAYNALLKTLEEPPKRTTFILASTDIQKFPVTIISRCQHLVLRSIPLSDLVKNTKKILEKEKIVYEEEAVELLARRGSGSMRDVLSLLGQCIIFSEEKLTLRTVESSLGVGRREIYYDFLYAILKRDSVRIVSLVSIVQEEAMDIRFFLQELTQVWRNLFLIKQSGVASSLGLTEEEEKEMTKISQSISLSQIHVSWQMTLDGQKRVLESLEPGIALELLLLNIACIPELLNIASLSSAEERVLLNTEVASLGVVKTVEKQLDIERDSLSHQLKNKEEMVAVIKNEEGKKRIKPSGVVEKRDLPHVDSMFGNKNVSSVVVEEKMESVEPLNENVRIQKEGISNKSVPSVEDEKAKELFTKIIENDTKLTQYRTMYISSYDFMNKICTLYALSKRGYEKLIALQESIESTLHEKVGEYSVVVKRSENKEEQIEKKIKEHPVVALLEEEFGTQCEYNEAPTMKYKK